MPKNLKNNTTSSHHPNHKSIIFFDEGPHTYTDNNGEIYESVTTFVGKYFEKFDAEAVSEACSKGNNPKYAGRSSREIMLEWEEKAILASAEGTNAHLYFEGLMSDWPIGKLPKPIDERCRLIFIQIEIVVKELKKYYVFIGAEVIIFSIKLKKAGMIDLLCWSEATNEIVIFDLKTNQEINTFNNFRKALPPIDYLDDSEISKYSLQLSAYQKILIDEGYFPSVVGYKRALVHVSESSNEIIPVEDYSFEVNEMLKIEVKK